MTLLHLSRSALSSANEACRQTPDEGAFVKSAAMDGRFWNPRSQETQMTCAQPQPGRDHGRSQKKRCLRSAGAHRTTL